MFVSSLLLFISCEEPMPMGEVPRIPVPDPTPSATDAIQNRPPQNPPEGEREGAPPPTTVEDVPRNEFGCGPTRFWAGSLDNVSEFVTIGGTIDFNSAQNGSYLIDVVSEKQQRAVFGFECSKPGAFSVNIPANIGNVWLFAFIDTDGNGPSETDPQGRTESFDVTETSGISDLMVPIRVGAVVNEAFELKPPGGGSGAPGAAEAPIDATLTEPPPEGVQGPSGDGEIIADQPLDVPEDNPVVAPQAGDAGDAEE